MSISTFTLIHVIISLVGIASGLVVALDLLRGQANSAWNGLFLGTTIATSVTGFFFGSKFGPPHAIGVLSLVVLAVACYALAARHLTGRWRTVYIITALTSLYFNAFVGVVQAFQKIDFLHALAPTQAEPPFAIAQGIVLVMFVVAGVVAVKRSRVATPALA